MARIVLKFGGTSVGDIDRIKNVARKVKVEVDAGHQVAVVVSAMSGVTNKLVEYCAGISPLHDAREYDAVVASGEQVTSGLTAWPCRSLASPPAHGRVGRSRSGPTMSTPRRVSTALRRRSLSAACPEGEVAVIAGFQGISPNGRITTLGRGGSDTSAVALAAAIKADRCDIYTDVDGVYTTDPRIVSKARKLSKITYEEMLEMASQGAKVLQTRSVELAMKHGVRVQVLSSFEERPAAICPARWLWTRTKSWNRNSSAASPIAETKRRSPLLGVADRPGVAAGIFGPLADATVNVDMIVQNVSEDGAAPTSPSPCRRAIWSGRAACSSAPRTSCSTAACWPTAMSSRSR